MLQGHQSYAVSSALRGKLSQIFGAPVRAVADGIDNMKMTALGAWAADELGRIGADSVEILWTRDTPSIQVSASFADGLYSARSEDISRRDKAVMTAVSQLIDDRIEATFYAKRVSGEAWWRVLGVAPDADRAAIDSAYHKLAQTMHPDRGGSDAAMARINVARDQAVRFH